MSKKFIRTDAYEADVDQMWAMITNQDYWIAKYEAIGSTEVRWENFTASEDSFTYTSTRNVPADLPSFVKKVVGDTNTVTTTERWTRAGDAASATTDIRVKNVPGGTTGAMQITPAGEGSQWSFDFDTKVSLPLIGGKFEGVMTDQTGSQLTEEKAFNRRWLAGEV